MGTKGTAGGPSGSLTARVAVGVIVVLVLLAPFLFAGLGTA
jgi:hypothetical protein